MARGRQPRIVAEATGRATARVTFFRASNRSRALRITGQFACSQETRPSTGSVNPLPSGVSSYSTRGGTSAYTWRVSMPSRSRLRTVAVSILWDIPGILRFRSENRPRNAGLPLRMKITNRLHLSPTRLSMSRKSQSWWLFSSAILFARCAIAWSFPSSLRRLPCRPAGIGRTTQYTFVTISRRSNFWATVP